MVQERKFRADLYYRLNVFLIMLPPLRERIDDIPPLVEHFLQRFAKQQAKPINHVPDDVMELLKKHDWPGNVRELQNVDSEKLAQKHFQLSSRTMSRRTFGRHQSHCRYPSKVAAFVFARGDKTFTTSPVTVTAASTSNALYSFYGDVAKGARPARKNKVTRGSCL